MSEASALTGQAYVPVPYSIMRRLQRIFQKERQNLMWDNRMIENRLAVAQQLMEVSHIMENVASDLYDLERVTPQFEEELRKGLRRAM
ncbi:MAG: hypothetical protein ACLVB1_03035 [Blautia obeum]